MKSHVTEVIAPRRVKVRQTLLREKLLAEFVGTFFLVFTVGASVAGSMLGPVGVSPAVSIGLVLGIQIYTFGAVSGGFFNPAVTLAVLLSGREKIGIPHAIMYMGAQFLGGLLGAFCAFGGTDRTFSFDYAHNGNNGGWGTSLELEMLFTMALCSTVLSVGTSNDAPNHYFGFAIGLTVTGGALASGGFDQGSFNPAVTFGINIANYANGLETYGRPHYMNDPSAGAWALFLLVPFLGAILAAAVFRGTRGGEYIEVVEAVPSSSV